MIYLKVAAPAQLFASLNCHDDENVTVRYSVVVVTGKRTDSPANSAEKAMEDQPTNNHVQKDSILLVKSRSTMRKGALRPAYTIIIWNYSRSDGDKKLIGPWLGNRAVWSGARHGAVMAYIRNKAKNCSVKIQIRANQKGGMPQDAEDHQTEGVDDIDAVSWRTKQIQKLFTPKVRWWCA